jgi:hypothetical protein
MSTASDPSICVPPPARADMTPALIEHVRFRRTHATSWIEVQSLITMSSSSASSPWAPWGKTDRFTDRAERRARRTRSGQTLGWKRASRSHSTGLHRRGVSTNLVRFRRPRMGSMGSARTLCRLRQRRAIARGVGRLTGCCEAVLPDARVEANINSQKNVGRGGFHHPVRPPTGRSGKDHPHYEAYRSDRSLAFSRLATEEVNK